MFAAWQLARLGYRPIVLERGRQVNVRHKDILQKFYGEGEFNPESNLLYGEGGAGTYSDGKLYTRLNEPYVRVVLQALYEHGASPDILIDGKPHIGSDRLPNICMRMRQHIEKMGGEIRFGARLDDLCTDDDGCVNGVAIGGQRLSADRVLIAIGHSARDTLRMLHGRGVTLAAKPFQLGVRIEHPQAMVDRWQYGGCAGHERLPPASYQTVAKGAASSGRDLFSFCMCPGGVILPTNESPGLIVTNGASRAAQSGPFANSGLVITVDPEVFGNDPLQGLAYQEKWESLAFEATGGTYEVPAQRASDFLRQRASDGRLETSHPLGGQWADLLAPVARLFHREPAARAAYDRAAHARFFRCGRLDHRSGDARQCAGPDRKVARHARIRLDSGSLSDRRRRGLRGRHHQRRHRWTEDRRSDHPSVFGASLRLS